MWRDQCADGKAGDGGTPIGRLGLLGRTGRCGNTDGSRECKAGKGFIFPNPSDDRNCPQDSPGFLNRS